MESIITCVLAFVVSAVAGRFLIPALRALHVGQSIREVGPTWHNSKQGTPVMGGLMFIFACLVCIVTAIGGFRSGDYTYLLVYCFALIFGIIGFLDDFIKVRKKRNLGLTEIQKLLLQLAAALVGGLCGFLIYNFHPAKVFMGDTGSLFLGGAVCGLAYALDMPLILILVGIIYIVETLSDIIQVGYFKLTHGKRIFKMAPLHHHFEKCGWSEVKIVGVFTAITVVFCILAYVGVMHRF